MVSVAIDVRRACCALNCVTNPNDANWGEAVQNLKYEPHARTSGGDRTMKNTRAWGEIVY
jgi:hypothetical protein